MNQALFAPRVLVGWLAAVGLTFALSLLLLLHGEGAASIGASTFSRSAIGHAGIAELLRRHGTSVVISRADSLEKLGQDGLLVVAEPNPAHMADPQLKAMLRAPRVLLVLPKWQGQQDRDNHAWIGHADPVLPGWASEVARRAITSAEAVRAEALQMAAPVVWTRNVLGVAPSLVAPAQLLRGGQLAALVDSSGGMLLGERARGGRHLWVLADPDVIANHGLAHGNAAFALALFDRLAGAGPVVFDESIHDLAETSGDPLQTLRQPRFAALLVQVLLALALLLAAAAARFGAPEPQAAPLKAGKHALVQNVARLFRYAGHQDALVRRYAEESLRDVARRLHAPAGLTDTARLGWLRHAGAARGVSLDGGELGERAALLSAAARQSPAALLALARDIWTWKREMLDGRTGRAGDGGGAAGGSPQGGGGTG